jgi:cytochrome c551
MYSFKVIVPLLGLFLIIGMNGCGLRENQSERLYQNNCMNCHGMDGEGLRQLIPPLADSDFVQENKESLACIIKYGLKGKITVNGNIYDHPMPGNERLSDVDIANIINYVNRNWNEEEAFVSPEKVKNQLQACKE